MFTMWPPSRMCGRQSRVIRSTPWTFVSRTVSSSSSLLSSNGSRPRPRPALLTRRPSPPSSRTASSTKRSELAGSVTSSSSRVSVSSRSTRRAPPATRAPSAASARAIAAPIPLDAPVTIAVLPSSPAKGRRLTADQGKAPLGHVSRHVLDLQRRVSEVEAVAQQVRELEPDRVAVGALVDEHVRRDRREAAAHRPDVEVVNVDHVRNRQHGLGDLARLLGRELEQDP